MRFNMPFGRVGARRVRDLLHRLRPHPDVIEQMLENMFIGQPPGNHDRILDFSTAVTGNLFFVPTVEFLDDPPSPPVTPGDGSLAIGSLKD